MENVFKRSSGEAQSELKWENLGDIKESVPTEAVQAAVDAMFAYLRDIQYCPKNAHLEPEKLAEPFRDLASGMLFLGESINESRSVANDLAMGILDSPKISRDNNIASGLKDLQATLNHLTWQAGQIAKGDYNQRLSFAGSLSSAINDMTAQLKERDEALHAEVLRSGQLAADAHITTLLLEDITKSSAELIIVIDRSKHEWLYQNHDPRSLFPSFESFEELKANLTIKLNEYNHESEANASSAVKPLEGHIKIAGPGGASPQLFTITGYPMTWMSRKAIAVVLKDVTRERRVRQELEHLAYYDTLTRAYSRHYGMLTLERWQEQQQPFVLVFADIDGLKYVNDTFGHAAGDEYILGTSRALENFHPHAILCRLGGDEFMLLARNVTFVQARARLEQLRAELSKGYEGKYERAFSFGLVAVDENNTKSASLLLSIADEIMYDDKRSRKKERRAPS